MRRGFESHTYLQFTPAKPDSFRAECPLGSCTNIPRQSTSSSPLQSGPKSPPTCSRVGLAWVRHATSPNLLQRRSASRGGSRFNVGQPKAYPEFIQNLRSVAQAEATGGVTPFSNSDPLSGNGPPGHWLLKTCKLRVSNPAAATILSGRIVLALNRPTENRQSSVRVRFLPTVYGVHRPMVRTPPCDGRDAGSIPVGHPHQAF